MKQSEWVSDVVRRINANWPHQTVPDPALAKWYDDLREMEVRDVVAAVEALYRDGREFPPNGGMIRRKAVELAADAPEWAEVWLWVGRYIRTGVTDPFYFQPNYAGRERPDHPTHRARRLRDRMPPLASSFIEAVGDRQLREACEQDGGGGEARLREKWASWSRRFEREAGMRGLDSGLAAVARVNAAPARIGEAIMEIASNTYGPDFEIRPVTP